MMKHKILMVEDEASIRGFLRINFQRNGYTVIEAESGEEGIRKARMEEPDIALLDIMLPGMSGIEVCKVLRKQFPLMGLIMLTALGQDMDKILGLEHGADDYVIKPFNTAELVLRVKALSRRLEGGKSGDEQKMLESGPLTVDIYSKRAYKNGQELELTPTEYVLLKLFMENQGKAFHRDELLNLVWGYHYIGDPKIVDVNIRRLRAKIEDYSSQPKFIQTIRGMGYRWTTV